jgi:hypothetical protein
MGNGQPIRIEWAKILWAALGLAFAVGMAWAITKGDIRANTRVIYEVCEDIDNLEQTDKDIIDQMNDTQVLLRGIQTDIEWIRSTLERQGE